MVVSTFLDHRRRHLGDRATWSSRGWAPTRATRSPRPLEHAERGRDARPALGARRRRSLFVAVLLAGTVPARRLPARPGDGRPAPLAVPLRHRRLHLPRRLRSVGIAYGVGAGTIRTDADVMKGMGKSMSTLGGYMVLVFFAAQFVAYFNWTNLGLIVAVKGAEALQGLGAGRRAADARVRAPLGVHQPLHGQRLGQVGDHGPGLRPDVHAARLHARADPGRLPRRRQHHEHHLADDVLLRADRGLLRALRPSARASAPSWRRCCPTRSRSSSSGRCCSSSGCCSTFRSDRARSCACPPEPPLPRSCIPASS